MKSYILGGLCLVTFAACIASNLAIPTVDAQSKDSPKRKARPTTVSVVRTKAVSLEVVTMKGCGPCARLKPVLNKMISEGYDIVIKDISKDTRGTTGAPSLYFLDEDGKVIRKEMGFKTAEQIKKWLDKCP